MDSSSGNTGLFPSLAFSPDTEKAVIAYLDVNNGHLMIAEELPSPTGNCPSSGGYWQCYLIDDVGPDTTGYRWYSIIKNKPVISYIDGIEHLAKVARYTGSGSETHLYQSLLVLRIHRSGAYHRIWTDVDLG